MSKRLVFQDQIQPAKDERESTSPKKSNASSFPSGCAGEVIIIQEDECEDQMQRSRNTDDCSQSGLQLWSPMSTAKTRAELAALASLILLV